MTARIKLASLLVALMLGYGAMLWALYHWNVWALVLSFVVTGGLLYYILTRVCDWPEADDA